MGGEGVRHGYVISRQCEERSVPYIKYIVFITRKFTIALNGIK